MIIIDSYFCVCFLTVIIIRITTLIIVKIKTKLIPSDKKTSDHLNPNRCSSKRFGAGAVRSLSAIDALRVVPLLFNINIWVNLFDIFQILFVQLGNCGPSLRALPGGEGGGDLCTF